MEEEKTFELVPVLDANTGRYVVSDFDNNKQLVQDFIDKEVNSITDIQDNLALKNAKNVRTDVRKKKDVITQARIHINALLLGDFNAQLKEIEGMLDTADKDLKGKIDTYNESVKGKTDKPTVITLVCKSYDPKAIDKVKTCALKCGCQVEVK